MRYMKYEANIVHQGRTFKVKLYCSWEPGRGWMFRYGNGFESMKLAAIQGKAVYHRDSMFKAIESYLQKLWDMHILKVPSYNTDPIRSFDDIVKKSSDSHKNVSLPAWKGPPNSNSVEMYKSTKIPSYAASSAQPVEMYKAILDYMKKPETVERMLLAETSNKFGL